MTNQKLSRKAKALYSELLKEIEPNKPNQETLALLCQAWGDYWDAIEVLNKDGRILTTSTTVKPHPALTVAKSSYEQYLKLADALGLTPKSQHKSAGISPDDVLDGLIEGK